MKMGSPSVRDRCGSARSMSSKAIKIKTQDMTCWGNENGY